VEALLRGQPFDLYYFIASTVFVQIPTLYLMVQLRKAETSHDFGIQSRLLKILIFLGMVSVLFLI
jgi:hypothetical protein